MGGLAAAAKQKENRKQTGCEKTAKFVTCNGLGISSSLLLLVVVLSLLLLLLLLLLSLLLCVVVVAGCHLRQ